MKYIDLELEFKRETGFRPRPPDNVLCPNCGELLLTDGFYTSDFVDFLVAKIETIQKQLFEASVDYKSEYEDALDEIGQLQDQLENAENEIRDLNNGER